MYATAAAAAVSPLFFYGLVHGAGMGLDGAAVAFTLCQLTACLGLLGYIVRCGIEDGMEGPVTRSDECLL